MARKISYKKADIEFAKLIKDRDKWTCQRCGKVYVPKSRGLHAAHIFSRRFKATRHDPENALALDFGCHMWGHQNPLAFHEWVEEYLGSERYEALKAKAKKLRVK